MVKKSKERTEEEEMHVFGNDDSFLSPASQCIVKWVVNLVTVLWGEGKEEKWGEGWGEAGKEERCTHFGNDEFWSSVLLYYNVNGKSCYFVCSKHIQHYIQHDMSLQTDPLVSY